jgi:hypothetical protein
MDTVCILCTAASQKKIEIEEIFDMDVIGLE